MTSTTHPPIAPVLTFLSEIGMTGNLAIVTKGPIDHLSQFDLLEVEEAQQLHMAGDTAGAAARVMKIEKRLGVTDKDRAAASRGEPWAGDLEAALRGLSPETEAEPDRMPIPHDFRSYNEPERANIDRYDQIRTIAKARKNKKGVTQAEAALARIAHQREHRVEVKERHDGIAETVALATKRGEDVEERPATGGAARMLSRDGLKQLHARGHLTDAQYVVGLQYREGYEARAGDLQAASINETGGRGHDNDQFVAARLKRAKALDFVARVDRAVAMGAQVPALQMLRSVAGGSLSLRAWGGGRAYERNKGHLIDALNVALQVRAKLAPAPEVSENPGETSKKPVFGA